MVVGTTKGASRLIGAYVFVRSGISWSQQAKLVGNDSVVGDRFGSSVSISGDTIAVGSPLDDDLGQFSGSAYIFVGSGSSWVQHAKLTAGDGAQRSRRSRRAKRPL